MNHNEDNLRILIAEDVEYQAYTLKKIIEKYGHNVDVVLDGNSAIEKTKDNSYDVVLMDISMPVLDGISATRIIKSSKNNTNLKVIGITGHVNDLIEKRCLDAGMDDYILKPIDVLELISVINKHSNDNQNMEYGTK